MGGPEGQLSAEQLLEQIRSSTDRDEQLLREQDSEHRLAPAAETALALLKADADPARRTLRVYAYIKHLFLVRSEGLAEAPEEKLEAAHQLLTRAPEEVTLDGGRVVTVTGRSYQALHEIARHSLRLQELEHDLRRCARLEEETLAAVMTSPDRGTRARARRRFRRTAEAHSLAMEEIALHRQSVYAHVFTESGAPATSIDHAPTWWEEITPQDDRRLMAAVWGVGAGRFQKLGPAPSSGETSEEPRGERFGWHSHFAQLERQMKLEPATLRNRDLYQHLTWLRAAADPPRPDSDGLDDFDE